MTTIHTTRSTAMDDENARRGVARYVSKKSIKLEDKPLQQLRRPLGGRNSVDDGVVGDRIPSKSNFDIAKKKDEVDCKLQVKNKNEVDCKLQVKKSFGKGLLQRKRKLEPVPFSVPLPKTIPKPIREASGDLMRLSSTIDSMICAVPENVTEIDRPGLFNSPAYAQDIIDYTVQREKKFALCAEYLRASNIKSHSRGVLVDWMTQVQAHADMSTESLHVAVALLDVMLSKRPISLHKLQLIGIVCVFISCKINERFPPEIDELLRLTENAYTRSEFKSAERLVLRSLRFDVYVPTAMTALDRCVQASQLEIGEKCSKVKCMALYLLQTILTETRCCTILPSRRAAAAFWTARKLLLPTHMATWNPTLSYYSGYGEHDVLPVAAQFAKMIIKAPESKFQGARNKYSSNSRYGAISNHPCLLDTTLLQSIASYQALSPRDCKME